MQQLFFFHSFIQLFISRPFRLLVQPLMRVLTLTLESSPLLVVSCGGIEGAISNRIVRNTSILDQKQMPFTVLKMLSAQRIKSYYFAIKCIFRLKYRFSERNWW